MASGNIAKTVGGWGTTSTVTMPFTPTKDGIVVGAISPSSASNSWVFINDNGNSYMRAMSSGGTGYGMTFPVIHGHSYTIGNTGNVSSSVYTFIPFA